LFVGQEVGISHGGGENTGIKASKRVGVSGPPRTSSFSGL
jgi:hypothetical protein